MDIRNLQLGTFGLFHEQSGPPTRVIELNRKREAEGLTPEENAELIGLSAFPKDPTAAALRTKQVLSEAGLAEFTAEDAAQLQSFFAQKHANRPAHVKAEEERQRKLEEERQRKLEEERQRKLEALRKRPPVGTKTSDDLELAALHSQARVAAIEHDWDGNPKEILDEMAEALPDSTRIFSRHQVAEMPEDKATPLELYFLSRLKSLPQFSEEVRGGGILRVMEGIVCMRDQVRTKRFMTGVARSLKQLEGLKEGEINIIDAGCGAIPIMGIYAALSSSRARVTCIEFNPNSATIAREVIKAFGLEDRISLVQGDATTYEPDEQVDLLISETMHSGLTEEPMIQILSHLNKYVSSDGVTLPSRVKVYAATISLDEYGSPKGLVKVGKNMHHYVEPIWTEVVDFKPGDVLEEIQFELSGQPGSNLVLVTSEVEVGEGGTLKPYDALICMPQVAEVPGVLDDPEVFDLQEGDRIQVKYHPGDKFEGVGRKI